MNGDVLVASSHLAGHSSRCGTATARSQGIACPALPDFDANVVSVQNLEKLNVGAIGKVGMVFQKPNPFPTMTIGENVISGLKPAQLKVDNKEKSNF